jgi:hypothetical protein
VLPGSLRGHGQDCRASRAPNAAKCSLLSRPLLRLQVGIGLEPDVSRGRIASNDRPNAVQVAGTRHHAKVLVPSTVPFGEA